MIPLIAVPGRHVPAGKAGRTAAVAAGRPYIEALHRAGAQEAVLMPVEIGDDDAAALLARFDGLMILGGADIDPARYGQARHETVYGVNGESDAFELALLRVAVAHDVPTLAICRGLQALNVALGGSLHQHITDDAGPVEHGVPLVTGTAQPVGALHASDVAPGTRLAEALGTDRPVGSSFHHQAIDRLGDGLQVVATASDGIVEGVEHERGWVVGVQWHPEDTAADDPVQQHLFDSFVEQCRVARAARVR